jgi:hypothetical protein
MKKKNIIVIILVVLLVSSWGYFFYSHKQSVTIIEKKIVEYVSLDSSKNAIQKEFDAALFRLQGMTAANSSLDSVVKRRNSEMNILKAKFKSLIGKQNATAQDLTLAKKLVGELNGKIEGFVKEIENLQSENKQLLVDKETLTNDNKNLNVNLANTESAKMEAENKVDIGSTLHASGFSIIPINEKNAGKEKSTSSAKKADKLRISFKLDENRIATSGAKQLFIVTKDPSGKTITESQLASGSLTTREEGQIQYTAKVDIEYKQGKAESVSFDLKPSLKYVAGNYLVSVYQNGFKIGEEIALLK